MSLHISNFFRKQAWRAFLWVWMSTPAHYTDGECKRTLFTKRQKNVPGMENSLTESQGAHHSGKDKFFLRKCWNGWYSALNMSGSICLWRKEETQSPHLTWLHEFMHLVTAVMCFLFCNQRSEFWGQIIHKKKVGFIATPLNIVTVLLLH